MATSDEPQRLAPDRYVYPETLLELRSYLLPDRLKTLARHLGLDETEVQSACADNIEPDERAIKVLTTWNDRKGPRVRDLVREMVMWTQGQCLEKRVWSEFAARRIHPSLIPEDLESLLAQDPPDSLAIPPEPAPHPTTPAITYNILQQNFYAPGQTPSVSEWNNAAITDGGNAIPGGPPAIGYYQNQGSPLLPGNPVTTTPGGQWHGAIGPSDGQFTEAATASQFSVQPAATSAVPPSRQVDLPQMQSDTCDLQGRLFDSIQRQWKKSITLDWLPGGRSFFLQEFYVGLRWKKRVQRFIQNRQEKLESVYDILKIAEPNKRPRATNILIEAAPGMGKTCSMAKLALDWDPESGDSDNPVNQFHYVFLLKLSDVDELSSLPDLIVKQHHKLEDDDKDLIKLILKGKTNERVLLLLDGYDEYTPGTNAEIDKAIEHSIGKCFLILTSRPGSDTGNKSYIYVSENIRKQMDGEVIIDGFDDDSIKGASTKYLEGEEKSAAMLKQTEEAGIYELLKVPIILFFVCLIYSEDKRLPRTRTEIYSEVFAKTMGRGVLKGTLKKEDLHSLLVGLGELAWKALNGVIKQLLLRKDKVENKHPDILKLGLLFEVGVETVSRNEQPTYVSFHHKSLQEFAAAKYITHRMQQEAEDKGSKTEEFPSSSTKSTIKEFFPHVYSIDSRKEVAAFCAGLLENPSLFLKYVSELFVKKNAIYPITLKSIGWESQEKSLSRDVVLKILEHEHSLSLVGPTTGLLTEVLPKDEVPLQSLKTLFLKSVELNNSDTKHLGGLIRDKKLPALRELDLSRNNLSGSLPELLPLCDAIQSMKRLILSDTGLNETDVHHLAFIVQNTKIESIFLAYNTLTGLLSEFKLCSQAKNLSDLHLESTSLSRSDVQHLGGLIQDTKLPSLRDFYLSNNSLSGSLPELLPLCDAIQSLETLKLSDTGLNETDLQHLAFIVHNTKLTDIDLSKNILTGLLEKFELCSRTQTIMKMTLSETKLNKTDIKYLAGLIRDNKLPRLREMELDDNNLGDIEDECGELIKAFAAQHPRFWYLRLRLSMNNNHFSGEFVTKWLQDTDGIKALALTLYNFK